MEGERGVMGTYVKENTWKLTRCKIQWGKHDGERSKVNQYVRTVER